MRKLMAKRTDAAPLLVKQGSDKTTVGGSGWDSDADLAGFVDRNEDDPECSTKGTGTHSMLGVAQLLRTSFQKKESNGIINDSDSSTHRKSAATKILSKKTKRSKKGSEMPCARIDSSTASSEQARVPQEITITTMQLVSPLRNQKAAVKAKAFNVSVASLSKRRESSRGRGPNNKEFNSPSSKLRNNVTLGPQPGDSPTDGFESDTSSIVRRRADPPGVITRSDSRGSIFLLDNEYLLDDDTRDDESQGSESDWSESHSASVMTEATGDAHSVSIYSTTSTLLDHARMCPEQLEVPSKQTINRGPSFGVLNMKESASDLAANLLVENEDEESSSSSCSNDDEKGAFVLPSNFLPGISRCNKQHINVDNGQKSPLRPTHSLDVNLQHRVSSLEAHSMSRSGKESLSESSRRLSCDAPNLSAFLAVSVGNASAVLEDEEEDDSAQSAAASQYMQGASIYMQNVCQVVSIQDPPALPCSPPMRRRNSIEELGIFKRSDNFEGATISSILTSRDASALLERHSPSPSHQSRESRKNSSFSTGPPARHTTAESKHDNIELRARALSWQPEKSSIGLNALEYPSWLSKSPISLSDTLTRPSPPLRHILSPLLIDTDAQSASTRESDKSAESTLGIGKTSTSSLDTYKRARAA